MSSPLKKRAIARAGALCACLAFGGAFAQQPDAETSRGPIPSVEAAVPYVPAPTDPIEPSAAAPAEAAPAPAPAEAAPAEPAPPAGSKMPWETAVSPPAGEEVPTPIVDEAAQPAVAEKAPEKPKKEKKVKEPKAPKEPKEGGGGFMPRMGARAGLGISAFAGHKAITTSDSVPKALAFPQDGRGTKLAISLGASVSTSVGFAAELDLADFVDIGIPFAVAAEFQYTIYTAYGSFILKTDSDVDFPPLYEAGLELHTLELPILARVRYDIFYAEAGPQFGANISAKAHANAELKRPLVNGFSFGPALGLGAEFNGVLLGLRGYINVLEYAKNSNGRPWALQVGVTGYPF